MCKNFVRHTGRILAILLVCATVLSTVSCAEAWDWLWSRDEGETPAPEDLILGDGMPEGDTDGILGGAVEYTGEAHSGTDIYYLEARCMTYIYLIDSHHFLRSSNMQKGFPPCFQGKRLSLLSRKRQRQQVHPCKTHNDLTRR